MHCSTQFDNLRKLNRFGENAQLATVVVRKNSIWDLKWPSRANVA